MQNITPHLWFDNQAQEAAEFYVSLFPGSRITNVTRLSNTPAGDCDLVSFELAGQPFMAIGAGPMVKFNPSVSFHARCKTKEEVDAIWEKLSPGAKVLMPLAGYPFSDRFGWLEDKFGLSWQVISTGGTEIKQRFIPALLFVGNVCGKAEEAINFYTSVFRDAPQSAHTGETSAAVLSRYGKDDNPDKEGTVRQARLFLRGQEFVAMDSANAHQFAFNEAISLMVPCDTQEEIDYFWSKLSADPKSEECGWLKDRYGLSWQIVPAAMREMLASQDQQQIARVTQAFLKMKKFDIAALKRAAAG